jgi:hypothetical protein
LQRFFRQSKRTLTWPKGPGFSGQNKKALPRFNGEASAYNLQKNKMLMVMFAILLGCINSGFDNAVGHTNA